MVAVGHRLHAPRTDLDGPIGAKDGVQAALAVGGGVDHLPTAAHGRERERHREREKERDGSGQTGLPRVAGGKLDMLPRA